MSVNFEENCQAEDSSKNGRMNSFLLVCDVFSFVFWENPRSEKNVSRLSDLKEAFKNYVDKFWPSTPPYVSTSYVDKESKFLGYNEPNFFLSTQFVNAPICVSLNKVHIF